MSGALSIEFVIGTVITAVGALISILLAIIGFFLYQFWQTHQATLSETKENTGQLREVNVELRAIREDLREVPRLKNGMGILMEWKKSVENRGQGGQQNAKEQPGGVHEEDSEE